MNVKISVYMKEDGSLVSFQLAKMIAVFEKRESTWVNITSIPISIDYSSGLPGMRAETSKIIEKLGDCRIIAGLTLSGVPFNEFDRHGFSIFDITEYGPEVFDSMLRDIDEGNRSAMLREAIIENTRPVETETPGIYYLDLITLQTECPEISSKQALRDFLENTPFLELRLICKHIPPWLENSPYDIRSEKDAQGNLRAVIRKRLCK